MSNKIKILKAQKLERPPLGTNSYYSPFTPQQNDLSTKRNESSKILVDWHIKTNNKASVSESPYSF